MAVTSKVTFHNLDNCISVQVKKRFVNTCCKDVAKMGNGGEEGGRWGCGGGGGGGGGGCEETSTGKGKMKNGNNTSL